MSKYKLLFRISFTLLLLAALVWLARAGIADFLRLAPSAYVESVQKGEVPLVSAELIKYREQLLLARSWDKSNPLIPEYLGQIAFMRAQLISLSPTVQAVFLHEAIDDFKTAIDLRPNSAILWADRMTAGSWLLKINSKLGRDDGAAQPELADTKKAFRRASLLGPWEPQVLRQLVKVGTLRYAEFTPDERVLVDGAVARARRLKLIF